MDEPAICMYADEYCNGELMYGPDPYDYELHGDDTPVLLCDFHYYMIAAEV